MKEIIRPLTSEQKGVSFDYDAMGNRIAKHVRNNQTGVIEKSTYYVLDAQGNPLTLYTLEASQSAQLEQAEHHIYGSSRLGVSYHKPTSQLQKGHKHYQIQNHLNNIITTITNRPIKGEGLTNTNGLMAQIASTADYSPFGVSLDGRTKTNSEVDNSYRYGFQDQEGDDEISGKGNSWNYTYRMHSSRVGRFFAVDPLTAQYPWNSPYSFSENVVIDLIRRNMEHVF